MLYLTHVCMYRGLPSWIANGKGCPAGPGGEAHQKRVQCAYVSQPRWYHRSRVTHAGSYLRTHTVVRFLCQLYSRQLRVACTLIYRGAVSHRARNFTLPAGGHSSDGMHSLGRTLYEKNLVIWRRIPQ